MKKTEIMKLEGYLAFINYDEDSEIYHGEVFLKYERDDEFFPGKIEEMQDIITFQSKTEDELEFAFRDSLKCYHES